MTRWFRICLGLLLSALATLGVSAASPKRVLILSPFSRDAEPYATVVASFRLTLAREIGEPMDFHEIPLDLARFTGQEGEEPLVAFLEERIKSQPIDLVVPIGGAGVQFAARHRERLFPETQILVVAAEPRLIPPELLQTRATLVTQPADLPGMVEDILQMQPDTARIAVVFGSSPLENFWVQECRKQFGKFAGQVEFTWLDDLPLGQMLERCSTLPPRSFILHGLFLVDAAGIPCEKNEALRQLHEVANAPLYAVFSSEFGQGPIGGRLFQNSEIGVQGAQTAARILRGERAGDIPQVVMEASAPVYDWRELQRWSISEDHLPPDRVIRFRQPSFWERYRWLVTSVVLFVVFQAALIIGLFVNWSKRRQGEMEATLIADISSKFVNLPPGEVDREILDAERRICEFFDLDIAAIWQWSAGPQGSFELTHFYHVQDGPQPDMRLSDTDFPWARQTMLDDRIVPVSSLDDLPAEGATDRESCRRLGIKSNLCLPLTLGGEPVGILGLNTTRAERTWPDALVKRLQLVAQIFTNALARKRSNQALRDSEERTALAAEAAQVGIWGWNLTRDEVWGSERWLLLFGFVPGDKIRFETVSQRIHPDDRETVERDVQDSLTNGSDYTGEFRIAMPDGIQRWIGARGRASLDAKGRPTEMLGTAVDVTQKKQAEKESRELRDSLAHSGRITVLGQLASSLAHELSQPLGAILRNAEAAEIMLEEPSPDLEELRAIVMDILKDDQRAGQVIDKLRSLLKKGSINLTPVNLPDVIAEVLPLVHADAVARHVKLSSSVASNLPMVRGDRIHLQQVLLNLLVNAIDAMGGSSTPDPAIEVSARLTDASAIEIRVTDNGPGIAGENLDRLFEPFFTTKSTGLGMGLPVSKTIIDAHKGTLWAENAPEGGACFCFTVAVAEKSVSSNQ